jgi:hypothetical protein
MQELKLAVHAHPTLSEVLDELFKAAKVQIDPFFTERLEKFWGHNSEQLQAMLSLCNRLTRVFL